MLACASSLLKSLVYVLLFLLQLASCPWEVSHFPLVRPSRSHGRVRSSFPSLLCSSASGENLSPVESLRFTLRFGFGFLPLGGVLLFCRSSDSSLLAFLLIGPFFFFSCIVSFCSRSLFAISRKYLSSVLRSSPVLGLASSSSLRSVKPSGLSSLSPVQLCCWQKSRASLSAWTWSGI